MTPIEILKAGRALIADPARWVQRFSAVRVDGIACTHDDPRAIRWCSSGALTKVTPLGCDDDGSCRMNAGLALRAACSDEGITHALGITNFNDTHTHFEVLAAWDRAIARLESA